MYASIVVYTNNPDSGILKELLSGIEEEGILFTVREQNGDAAVLSRLAAEASALGCGIGCCEAEACLSAANTPGHIFHICQAIYGQYRVLGQNAGRFVKKQSFVL